MDRFALNIPISDDLPYILSKGFHSFRPFRDARPGAWTELLAAPAEKLEEAGQTFRRRVWVDTSDDPSSCPAEFKRFGERDIEFSTARLRILLVRKGSLLELLVEFSKRSPVLAIQILVGFIEHCPGADKLLAEASAEHAGGKFVLNYTPHA